jgi:hypothetical protein
LKYPNWRRKVAHLAKMGKKYKEIRLCFQGRSPVRRIRMIKWVAQASDFRKTWLCSRRRYPFEKQQKNAGIACRTRLPLLYGMKVKAVLQRVG